MVDKALVRQRYRRSLPRYDGEAALQREMAASLVAAVRRFGRPAVHRVFEIGCGTGQLTRQIAAQFPVREFYANDINELCITQVTQALGASRALHFLGGDIERMATFPADLDLVASNAVLHWLDEPEALLTRLAPTLAVGGTLALTTFGPENLREIGEITGQRLPYRTADEIRRALTRDYRLRFTDERRVQLRFATPRRVLEHLRGSGANGLSRGAWTRGDLKAFEREYRSRFTLPDGAVSLTYHPLLFVAER